jgi:hypothetical protein
MDRILQYFETDANVSHDNEKAIINKFPEIPLEALQKVQRRIAHNQHKLVFPPICKVSK